MKKTTMTTQDEIYLFKMNNEETLPIPMTIEVFDNQELGIKFTISLN